MTGPRQPLVPVGLAAMVTLTACGGDQAATTPSTLTTTTTGNTRIELERSCVHEERAVRIKVRYPQRWYVNDEEVQPCSAFDAEPFDLRPGTEFPRDVAVLLYVEPLGFNQLTSQTGERVSAAHGMTIDGRRALRQVVNPGADLQSPGPAATRYVVDVGADRSVIATTFHVEGNDFQQSVEVLDAMVKVFQIEP